MRAEYIRKVIFSILSALLCAGAMYMVKEWYIDKTGKWDIYNFVVLSILAYMTFYVLVSALLDLWISSSSPMCNDAVLRRMELKTSQTDGRMYNIEFLRIIFTLIIIDHHFLGRMHIWNASWQAVNLFFILSGFFMAKTFSPDKQILQYIKNSFIRYSPLIILGGGIRCLFENKIKVEQFMSEVFFLSTTGIYDDRPYNKVSWYISVLFWVLMLYLYILKSVKRETANLIFSITAFLGIIAVNKRGFRTEFLGDKGDIGYLFEMTMVYGLAMVAIGYFTWHIYDQMRHKVHGTSQGKIVCTIMEIALLVYSVAMMHVKDLYTPNQAVCSAVFCALVILFSLKIGYISRLLDKNIWTKLSKYCLAVYLTQAVVVWGIFPRYFTEHKSLLMDNQGLTITAVLAACCCLGVWAHHVIEKPCAKFLKRILP